jgi:hypothetical protein
LAALVSGARDHHGPVRRQLEALALSGVAGQNPPIFVNFLQDYIQFNPDWTRGPAGSFDIRVPHPVSRWCVMSTPYEMFRSTLPAFTPDGERATVIVTRRGQGSEGRVWVTFSGAWVTTAVMIDAEAERLEQLVSDARKAHR